MKHSWLLSLLVLAASHGYGATSELPQGGLQAEQEGRWEDAATIYRNALGSDQSQADVWLRLADIDARLKRPAQAAEALGRAAQLRPRDATLWKKLSEARATAGDPVGALAAVVQANELAPDQVDYLRAQGQLAIWANDSKVAITTFRRLLVLDPQDASAWLWLARVNSWQGAIDDSVAAYSAYLQQQPDDKVAWLEFIKVQGWRGDYPGALDSLDRYRARFGEDRGYLAQRARADAWLGKTVEALALTQQLLADTPDDVEVHATRLIAFNQANDIDMALAELQTIQALRPDATETRSLQRYVLTPLRSSISLGMNYSSDSSDLHIFPWTLEGDIALSPSTRLMGGLESQRLDAVVGSGLENIDGSDKATSQRVWGGVRHRFSPLLAGDLQVGASTVDGAHQVADYRLGLDWRHSDDLTLRADIGHGLLAISPRTVSLHLERDTVHVQTRWTPGTRFTVDAAVSRDVYSDGNGRWELTLAPRRAVLRTQGLNVDLGLSGAWSGFDQSLNNGYDNPLHFQRYALTSFFYWKINDDSGVSLSVSVGQQKDDTMSGFKTGGDAVVQGFFGINRDYALRVYGSLMSNEQISSGAYRSNNLGFVLTRRF